MNKKIRETVYQKYGGHCAYCGKEIKMSEMQVDHLVPLRRNDSDEFLKSIDRERGTDDLSNLMPSCRSCNFRKGLYPIETFRQEIVRQRDGIVKMSFQVKQSIDYGLMQIIDKPIVFYFEKNQGG